jgi:hypothetical protein
VLGYKVCFVTVVADEATDTKGRTVPPDDEEREVKHQIVILCGSGGALAIDALIAHACPAGSLVDASPLQEQARRPLLAQSRHAQCADECPLLGAKRTLARTSQYVR